jgi:RNA polymerase sigma factor (sigma-70 family)
MPPLDPEDARWFSEELQPLEPMLRGWLVTHFRSTRDIDDIVQEAFLRVIRARERSAVRSTRAFLFATARNLAIDHLRRRSTTPTEPLAGIEVLSVLDEGDSIPETASRNQEFILLTDAIQSLPDRCRQIFTLRKIYGLSQKEIAARLGISENTVSAQLTIGFHKCARYVTQFDGDKTAE